MKKFMFALPTLMLAASAFAAPPAGFNARVEALRQKVGVPGMAIAIVEDGKITLTKGYGVRQLGSTAAVDADTIFPIGSTTKAMTAAALATLVDAGKFGWEDKVADLLPGFQMFDPWVTRELTVRDLLVHSSGLGLGAGDLMFVPRSNISRAETVRRLRYIKPQTSFRSTYAYSNLMYVVAGQLIEVVSGEPWEDYLRKHVLLPAGMSVTTTDNARNFATVDRAYPHARTNGGMRGAGDQEQLNERDDLGRNAAPAGGVASSANDMAKWLQVMLANGTAANGTKILSTQAHAQLWKPTMQKPVSVLPAELKALEAKTSAYGLGWDITDYHGAKLIWHGGAVFGFQTAVVVLPEQKVGFAITINCEDGVIVRGLMYELIDHYLGVPPTEWTEKYVAYRKQLVEGAQKVVKGAESKPVAPAPFAVPLTQVAGTYTDPWYGNVEIGVDQGGLTIDFKSTPRMRGRLEHWRYDTFITRFDDKTIEPAYVTLALDKDGKVDRITMKAASPITDFSWDYHDLLFTPSKINNETTK